ncbi:aminotransferase class I/II-fold pyridoxal phosphate-dependent enzyme [Pedobacter sp. LMG 31464]|uniref:Aminotransferase class I/II-fold pyridoxal phosphate-dependent enzyme n=1 Tax=Pedobacter planticolens TaxID=2679964 RepID=A0A923E0Y4_9SPHI|nr:aminotransferase class I/II-fold pyridoxal phosphate-dependent enzyme [Pedobacter planticolens]MBB2146240.1 aminotransferase class I/II-fold pyridoxal phosphate-dependent enzyme [Pedobacter planticolens]
MQGKNSFNQLNVPLSSKINIDGQSYLYFGGTAYLGIPQNDNFIKLYLKGIEYFGLNNGTSRNNNIQLGIYDEVENYAANRFGSEAALITSSGYLAAQLTVKQLSAFGEIRYAPATHPALWLKEDPKTAGSFKDWTKNIINEINLSEKKNWVLISNSMNNLFPESYDFSFINQINKEKQVVLVVDDSHGIGINNNGLSDLSAIPRCNNVDVLLIASMAKALGVDAGLVLGPEKIIKQLKKSNEFLGASPPSAAGIFAFMHSEEIYKSELAKLKENMLLMNNALVGNNDWHFITDFPVFFCKNADLSAKLLKQNILVSSFPYPDKDGPNVNRIVLSSWHSKADIQELIASL